MPKSDHQADPDDQLPAGWFARHPVEVAIDLVGCWLEVRREGRVVRARITETEAYAGREDAASHASMYKAGREILTMAAGSLYMQRSYGLHTMTNIVSHLDGELGAVLIRAAEDPIRGADLAQQRRGVDHPLLIGPGNFSQGMGMRLDDLGTQVGDGSAIRVLPRNEPIRILAGPRIGISRAVDAPWRFWDATSTSVSRTRRGTPLDQLDLPAILDHFGIDTMAIGECS